MPQPTSRQSHVDAPLTNVSVAFIQDATGFVADKVFPTVPVNKQSDKFFTYDRRDWFRDEAQKRAPATESAGGGFNIATGTYFADVFAFHKDIDPQVRANSDAAINPDRDATEYVTQKMMIRRERQWADDFFKKTVWTTDLDGVAAAPGAGEFLQWDNPASTPIADISEQIIEIASSTGGQFRPNKFVLGPRVWQALRNHPEFLDRVTGTGSSDRPATVNERALAEVLGIDQVMIGWGVVDSSAEGAASADLDFIFSKSALLVFSQPSPGLLRPSGGYIFSWTGLLGAGAFGNRIRRFPMDELGEGAIRIEGEMAFDAKLISADLGTFFATAVA